MIARITGRLEELHDGVALVAAEGGLWYEVLVPAFDTTALARRAGQEVVLHTIHYVEGDPARGAQTPRLIGFLAESDRAFFRVFTTVKGMGIRRALRALARPPAEIAAAVQARDPKPLRALPEIGPRMAERIVTELHDKLADFAAAPPAGAAPPQELPEAAREAVAVLVQLGERQPDAQALVERVRAVAPELDTPEAILHSAYRLRAGAR